MSVGTDALLMALVVALYLFDSLQLLATDEAVLLRPRAGRWRAAFGADGWRIAAREPYLPNPFTPQVPVFRLRWRLLATEGEGAAGGAVGEVAGGSSGIATAVDVPPVVDRLRTHVLFAWLVLFVLLPATLYAPRGPLFQPLLPLALFYFNLGVAFVRLHRVRAEVGLTGRGFAELAFECASCPPFAVNLVRRLCLQRARDADFVAAANGLLRPPERHSAIRGLLRRIDEQMAYAEEGGGRMTQLAAARARLAAGSGTS